MQVVVLYRFLGAPALPIAQAAIFTGNLEQVAIYDVQVRTDHGTVVFLLGEGGAS
jgi:hypothetical protein